MSNKILILSAMVLAVVFSSCERSFEETIFRDEKLSMKRINYTGSELRTDGYYIKYDTISGEVQASTTFLYRNGVSFNGYSFTFSESELKRIEDKYADGSFYKESYSIKLLWQVFQIIDNTIVFEGWAHDHDGKYATFKQYGTILNDTTFHIHKDVFKNEEMVLDNTFHFKQFAPKPDSTNNFIK